MLFIHSFLGFLDYRPRTDLVYARGSARDRRGSPPAGPSAPGQGLNGEPLAFSASPPSLSGHGPFGKTQRKRARPAGGQCKDAV